MLKDKSRFMPILITIIILIIVIYLFANIEQTTVKCSRRVTDELGITIVERINSILDNKKIDELQLTKTILLPDTYYNNIDYIEQSITKSYAYIDKDKVDIRKYNDRVVVKIKVKTNETLILNNIKFTNNNALNILINSNTKSSEVVTLKIGDTYTLGEYINYLKINGYSCG